LPRSRPLRALAVTTATRSDALPDIPTVGDFVPDFEASTWFGIGAPKNTPPEIIDKLNKEVNVALADPKLKPRLADLGGTVTPGSSAVFGTTIADRSKFQRNHITSHWAAQRARVDLVIGRD